MANVYSYLRFSSARQSTGTSLDRQLDYARRWAAENGMRLDESLTMRDEGLSAYHQRHVKTGALGAFLAAINEGRIPAGSVLIVEGLDRLSRAEPILAQAQLAQIVNAEITVVTASDGKQYNREKLKANPMDLVYSLLVMIRAHEESETKSKRVKAAIRKHCEAWQAGKRTITGRLGKPPQWLRFADGEWSVIPEREAGIRMTLDLFRRGWGHFKIIEALEATGLALGDGKPNANQIYRTVRNEALIGDKVLLVDGEEFRLAGYYPALLTAAEFAELQLLMDDRARSGGGPGKSPGILTGIGVTCCGYCGAAMVANNPAGRSRRLMCSSKMRREPCPMPSTCGADMIEAAIMEYCSDQMRLDLLLEGSDSQATNLRGLLAGERAKLVETDAKLARITEAMLNDDSGEPPAVFIKKARDLETAKALTVDAIKALEQRLVALDVSQNPEAADAWNTLRQGVAAGDYEAKLQARRLISDTFERIAIYTRGLRPSADAKTIDLLLVAKGGGNRMLSVDRRSGQMQEGLATSQ